MLCLAGVLILACSLSQLPIPAIPTLPPLVTPLTFPTSTASPLIPPTYTLTPTLIGQKPSPVPTDTPLPSATFSAQTPKAGPTVLGPAISPTIIPGGTGFDVVELSTSQLFIGSCGKQEVQFTAQVTYPDKIESVVLFLRLRNKATGEDTGWDRGTAMDYQGEGRYTHTLHASSLGDYTNTWVVYQLVGTDDEQAVRARSPIYPESLTLMKCP